MENLNETTTASSGTGDYSKPITLQKRRKLIQCDKCGGIYIDKCSLCNKSKTEE